MSTSKPFPKGYKAKGVIQVRGNKISGVSTPAIKECEVKKPRSK